MRVIVAPDCFTGTLTAVEAARAIATGWLRHAVDDEIIEMPLADGGPGFLSVISAALAGDVRPVVVTGPLGEQVPAAFLLVGAAADPSGRTSAYLESALACGLDLIPQQRRDPSSATSRGVGDLLVAAVRAGAERIVVGLGGSGSNDGGAGLLDALGGLTAARGMLGPVDLVVASDVDSPLLGAQGASLGFARQKGATAGQLPGLEAAMTAWAATLVGQARGAGVDSPERFVMAPGAGAAGGIGFALLMLGAGRLPGAQVVVDTVGLESRAAAADLVVTGEGTLDWQSLRGKAVTAVARAAQRTGTPVVVIAGQVMLGRRELAGAGIDAAYGVVTAVVDVDQAMLDPAGTLAERAARVAATWSPRRPATAVHPT